MIEKKVRAFTDENLARLRTEYDQFSVLKIEALIRRLEAAELALKIFRELESEKSSYDDAVSLYNAWRRAAGR